MTAKKTNVQNRLKEILLNNGMRQIDIVNKLSEAGLETSKSTISNLINNRYDPSLNLAIKLCEIVNIPFDRVFYVNE